MTVPAGQNERHRLQGPVGVGVVPQVMPLELLATTPPIVQADSLAGSGPSLRPYGASRALTWRSTAPGCTRTRAPPSSTSMPRKLPPGVHEEVLSDRLPAQAGAPRTEGQRKAGAQQRGDLPGALGHQDGLRGEQVVRSVVGHAEPVTHPGSGDPGDGGFHCGKEGGVRHIDHVRTLLSTRVDVDFQVLPSAGRAASGGRQRSLRGRPWRPAAGGPPSRRRRRRRWPGQAGRTAGNADGGGVLERQITGADRQRSTRLSATTTRSPSCGSERRRDPRISCPILPNSRRRTRESGQNHDP